MKIWIISLIITAIFAHSFVVGAVTLIQGKQAIQTAYLESINVQ
jgi:hypothetical protein